MWLQPVDVSRITRGVETMLRADVRLSDVTITRSEEITRDPSQCPWIGIYRAGIKYPPRVLGLGQGFREQRCELVLLIQQADGSGGAECEIALEKLVQDVLSAFLSDPTLGGTVNGFDEVEIRYPDYQRTADAYMQTAALYFTALGGISVSQ